MPTLVIQSGFTDVKYLMSASVVVHNDSDDNGRWNPSGRRQPVVY